MGNTPHRLLWLSPTLPGAAALAAGFAAAAIAGAIAAAALAIAAAAIAAAALALTATAHHMRPWHLPELHRLPVRDRVRPRQRPAHGHRGAA